MCLLVCFAGVFDRDLWTPDEPRDAAICLEMANTGETLIPRLASRPFVEKPPLYFAVGGAFASTFGSIIGNTGAIRLVSVLCGLGVMWFTFLIGRRLFDRSTGILAAVMLATMVGFVENFHWIRVDPALSFFTAATVWAMAEALAGERRFMLVVAALLAAGAFLTKGFIALIFLGTAWAALMAVRMLRRPAGAPFPSILPGYHIVALFVFSLAVGSWALAFRSAGGKDLWDEWFWTNHFGRATGSAVQLGHIKAGKPFYYMGTVAIYTLPWLPLLIPWLISLFRGRKQDLNARTGDLFAVSWILAVVIVLSLSSTKRDVYLCPMLPTLAIGCARGFSLETASRGWSRAVFGIWAGICVAICLASAATQLPVALAKYMNWSLHSAQSAAFLRSFSPYHALAVAALALCALLVRDASKGPILSPWRIIAPTALAWVALISVPGRAIDIEKNMRDGTILFAKQISPADRISTAFWKPSETVRGCFYYYAGWSPAIVSDPARAAKILSGADREYNSIVTIAESDCELTDLPPYKVTAAARIGAGVKREIRRLQPATD